MAVKGDEAEGVGGAGAQVAGREAGALSVDGECVVVIVSGQTVQQSCFVAGYGLAVGAEQGLEFGYFERLGISEEFGRGGFGGGFCCGFWLLGGLDGVLGCDGV